jgi:hypothetical protein
MLEQSLFGKRPGKPITPESQGTEESLTDLERQEQLDAQCAEEAEKLGTNIERLTGDINVLGGPERFKEIFETTLGNTTDTNKAGQSLRDLSNESIRAGMDAHMSKMVAVLGTVLTGVEGLLIYLQNNDVPEGMEQYDASLHIAGGVGAVLALGGTINFIKEKFKSRRLEKHKKIQNLKFKMTGTEVK